MTNQISQKIDSFAKKHLKELKQLEKQNGREFTKYDIAEYMLSKGEINKPELNSWLKTTEGSQNYQLSSYQKKISLFGNNNIAQNFDILDKFEKKSYLDSLTDKIEINGKKYEDTIENRKIAKQVRTQKDRLNTQFEKLVEENQDLVDPNDTRNVVELTKDINTSIENERFDKMTHEARKNHITSKFLSAYNKNDKEGMFNALGEFNAYMCQYIDDKLGITDAKQSIKEFVHLDDLVAYVDKHVDDGNNAISIMEGLWEFTKGLGDAADSFIGTQGLEMVGLLGAASKAIQASGKAAPVLGGAMQAYFGVEGTVLMANGTEKIVNADTKEDIRAGGSEVGMGAIMVGGAVGSVRSGVKGYKAKQEQAKFDNTAKEVANQYPEVTQNLAEYKTPDGKPLFTKEEINSVLVNCKKTIESNPEKLFAILNNPQEVASIIKYKNRAAGLWRAINEPFNSTIEANPEVFGVKAKTKTEPAKTAASKPAVSADMSIEAMKELAKTPEGVKQLEDAGLVITKNTVSKLENVYEGQSQSPARQIKKLDLTGTPEEVVAKNPGLKYDAEQGKFFREVSWDGGKTMERMYVDTSDPKGYFMIQYGKEPWDGALLGGTEAAKSYVEPNAYNATGAKNYLKPEEMGYEWTEASKAAPVRFAEVPEGVKGIVGKEGFQPITGGNQVIAIDVKGQPYINTTSYVRNNTKGLSQDAVKVLDRVTSRAAQSAVDKLTITPERKTELTEALKEEKYADAAIRVIDQYPEVMTKLLECKNSYGDPAITNMDEFFSFITLYRFRETFSNPEKLYAILANPEEVYYIREYGMWHLNDALTKRPLESTIEANPDIFGIDGKGVQSVSSKPSIDYKLKYQILEVARRYMMPYHYRECFSNAIINYPDLINRLAKYKNPDGELAFSPDQVARMCLNRDIQLAFDSNPEKIFALLERPQEIKFRMEHKIDAYRLEDLLEADAKYPEFLNKCDKYNTPEGEPLLDYTKVLCRFNDKDLNPNKVFTLLDNPREISYIKNMPYEKRADAIATSFLRQTKKDDGTSLISPILKYQLENALEFAKYDKKEVLSMIDKYPEVVTKLADCKTPDGQLLFKPQEICDILSNCQSAVINTPQVIFDMINTPNVKTELLNSENKAFVLWKRLYD